MGDAYLRLTRHGPRWPSELAASDGLLFIDWAPGAKLSELRNAPFALAREAEVVLLREPGGSVATRSGVDEILLGPLRRGISAVAGRVGALGQASPNSQSPPLEDGDSDSSNDAVEDLGRLLESQGLRCRSGVVHQPLGAPASIRTNDDIEDAWLDRARAVELEGLLRLGNGIWTPTGYHYRLPSGEHAPGFIRTADAIAEPRDAQVLASWLHRHARDRLGIVADTGTLSPVILALESEMRGAGMELGPIEVLGDYPRAEYEVERAVRIAGQSGSVLALLSVSSSGTIQGHLIHAMKGVSSRLPAFGAPRFGVEILVSKKEVDEAEDTDDGVVVRTWHPRPGEPPLVDYGAERAELCDLCRDDQTAHLVPISPGSFEGTFEASINRITPDPADALKNRPLWEGCDRAGAIDLEEDPVDAKLAQRAAGPMAIRFDLAKLVSDERFRSATATALSDELSSAEMHADLVLMRKDEFDIANDQSLLAAIGEPLGSPSEVVDFPGDGPWPAQLEDKVKKAKQVTVLCLGSVEGGTLQRALVAVQQIRGRGEQVVGVVLHARPSERRDWETLQNAYGDRLYSAFHSYLPLHSPLEEERLVLGSAKTAETAPRGDALVYLEKRLRFCHRPSDEPELGLFWGSVPGDTLTRHSYFGDELHAFAVLAAVGSAMERRRQEASGPAAPEQRVFDIRAIARSYYDPLILAAMLRWLKPREAWWGVELREAETTIGEVLARATLDQQRILVPEFLLAAAEGKVPRQGVIPLRSAGETLSDSGDLTDEQQSAFSLGMAVAPSYSD